MTRDIVRKEEGASAVEYGLLVAGIAAVIALIVLALGTAVNGQLDNVENCVANPTAATCA